MKKVLSLILAMAIILSCFAVGMVFSVNAESEYLDVSCLSGNNWQITNKLGLNGTTYPNNDSAVGVAYTGSKTYHAEPGENYVANYENRAFDYSGHYIFSSNTSEVFINDETTPQYFRYQAQLAATEENSVIIYVELPDYVAQKEDWGLGFYRPADAIGEFRNANGYARFFKRTADITEGFSYLSVDGKKWENGIIYAQVDGEKVIKTNLPSGFKGYIRLDLSKLDTVISDGATVRNDITTLHELDFAFNAVGAGDFVLGGLMYAVSNTDSTVLNFNGKGYCPLAKVEKHIEVLGMAGYENYMDTNNARIKKISASAVNGTTDGRVTTSTTNKTRQEAGQAYTALYNLSDGSADTTNSELAAKCYGLYEVKSNSGTYISDTASPEAFVYQTKLKVTKDNAVIVYVELPDYETNGADWGFGLARRGDGTLSYVAEFNNGNGYQRYLKRTVNNTTGFSYLPAGEDEWVSGTVYAETGRVMKTDLPSGFKGYVRFDLSKFNYVNGNGTDVSADIVKLIELNFAYNGVTETDILSVGGLMYITTPNDGKVLNFKYAGYVPMTNNILSVRAQNLITDTANTTNLTGTNIKLVKGGSEADTTAVMKLAKSGGLFLDDGFSASFTPGGKYAGNGVLMGRVVSNYNTVREENLGLQLKAGVNKFMFYVELPDVTSFEGITDEHNVLATKAIWFTNGSYVTPYGTTYEYMDIRDGVWHESTIVADGDAKGAFSGLPTDGFKGYIKMDLNGLVTSQTSTYTIKQFELLFSRCSWGRPLVIGGFYAIDIDSSAETPYFMDTKTGEMATTKVVAGDFSGDEKYDATDLALAIKYLIKHPDITGVQTARASAFDNPKADFSVVSLVQLKKILAGNFTPATLQ